MAIRRRVSEDLYIVMPAFDLKDQTASLQVVINPLVNWIWVGFGVMALGTGIALLPERTFNFALSRLPAGVATTTTMLLLVLLLGASASAQHIESAQTIPVLPRTPLERELQRSLVCMCGTCGHKLLSECACGTAAMMREELAEQVKLGKDKEQVFAYFVAKYGSQEPLGAPIDEGFNRLAWLVPYLLGGGGALAVGLAATKWSRPQQTTSAPAAAVDPRLEARLDDELRNLD